MTSVAKLSLRFLLTMPLEVAKKARMKCCSIIDSLSQSTVSVKRSILQRSSKKLWLSCTSSKCHCVEWERGRSDGGLPEGVAQEQHCHLFWHFCGARPFDVMTVDFRFPCGQGVGGVVAELVPVFIILADEVCDLVECLVHDNVLEGHGDDDD